MNKWKLFFLGLASLNFMFILTAGVFLFLPNEEASKGNKLENTKGDIPFLISTDKKSLTKLVNHYLEKETDQENLQYKVVLEEDVKVYGSIKAFNKDVDMALVMEPKVKTNGNMQLLVKELSIGQLKLPASYVLKYMNTYYNLPSYVVIDPSNREIDININELKLKNGLSARAESFHLEKDDITFTLYVPLP